MRTTCFVICVVVAFAGCALSTRAVASGDEAQGAARTTEGAFRRSEIVSDTLEGCRRESFTLYSPSMGRDIRVIITLPPAYDADPDREYPILYALNGKGAPYTTWASMSPLRTRLKDKPMIVASFDAGYVSFYLDAGRDGVVPKEVIYPQPLRKGRRQTEEQFQNAKEEWKTFPPKVKSLYTTFFFEEFVPALDHFYRVDTDNRALTGFSMGGFGALHYALEEPGMFRSVSSLSGVFYDEAAIRQRLKDKKGFFRQITGKDYDADKDAYAKIDQFSRVQETADAGMMLPPVFLHCGLQDRLLDGNRKMRDALKAVGCPVVYKESEGSHDWTFWRDASAGVIDFHWAHFGAPSEGHIGGGGQRAVAAGVPRPVVQPTDSSDKWELRPNPMPPIETIVARPVEPRPVYGLYGWRGEYQTFRDSIRKVGYRSYRMSGILDDETMAMVVADDMEVMMTLACHVVTPEGRRRKDRSQFESDGAFIADYVRYVEDFLARYGPKGTFFADHPDLPHRPITHVEILNEPNFHYMIPPKEGQARAELQAEREALYAELLPAVHNAVKVRWPTVTIVGFGTGGGGRSDVQFITNVHKLNPAVGRSYDILSTHPYSKPAPFEVFQIKPWGGWAAIDSLHGIRTAVGAAGAKATPVWYTEVGWPISHTDGGRFAPPQAKGPFVSPLMQAAYIVRTYALALRLGVGRVHIMHATDTDGFNGGVFTQEGVWRPAAYATQTMIKLMPHPKLLGALYDGADGLYAYTIDPDATDRDTTPVVMVWNVPGPKVVTLPVPAGRAMVAVDMFGHRRLLTVADDKASVETGPCPVYVAVAPDPTDPD